MGEGRGLEGIPEPTPSMTGAEAGETTVRLRCPTCTTAQPRVTAVALTVLGPEIVEGPRSGVWGPRPGSACGRAEESGLRPAHRPWQLAPLCQLLPSLLLPPELLGVGDLVGEDAGMGRSGEGEAGETEAREGPSSSHPSTPALPAPPVAPPPHAPFTWQLPPGSPTPTGPGRSRECLPRSRCYPGLSPEPQTQPHSGLGVPVLSLPGYRSLAHLNTDVGIPPLQGPGTEPA